MLSRLHTLPGHLVATAYNFWRSLVSHLARKYRVPDALAHVYDFANTLDLRRFVHHGVRHETDDELKDAGDLAAWQVQRGLSDNGNKVSRGAFEDALRLRAAIRAHLECDPAKCPLDANTVRKLNEAFAPIPFVVEIPDRGSRMVMRSIRRDAPAGIGAIVSQLYDASANGTLGRMKMCASEECRRIFYDRSKLGTRRWCQATLCGNRRKTRAYRERLPAGIFRLGWVGLALPIAVLGDTIMP
jgi:predicted RNA-binding Zn ribbon-like protein